MGQHQRLHETKDGKPVYDWTGVDRIIDTYLARGVRPYLQIGFMPEALSTAPPGTPYQHSWRPGFDYNAIISGWAYPPKDYDKWRELVYQWTRHNVERYGRAEVERWYFEVWNEANGAYWKASPEEFYKLHDYAVDGVRRALPTARVGGPDSAGAGGAFMDGFLRHVTSGTNYATGQTGTPTDFLAFHAKGQPSFVDGHVRMGIATQLKEVDRGFVKATAIPALATKPVVIGESDPEGCAACPGPENAYRNGTMYSSYTAASFARIWELAERRHVNLEGVLSWSFEFENQPWFAVIGNWRATACPCGAQRLSPVRPARSRPAGRGQRCAGAARHRDDARGAGAADIGTIATRLADGRVAILVWHYHDDDVPRPGGGDPIVGGRVEGHRAVFGHALAGRWRSRQCLCRLESDGRAAIPDQTQYAALEKSAEMHPETLNLTPRGGPRRERSSCRARAWRWSCSAGADPRDLIATLACVSACPGNGGMAFSSLLLIVGASFIHATWNLLAKRAAAVGPVFVFAYNLVSVIGYAPWVLYQLSRAASAGRRPAWVSCGSVGCSTSVTACVSSGVIRSPTCRSSIRSRAARADAVDDRRVVDRG